MSIVLKTSTALPAQSACVSEDTPGLRGRADVDRGQDLNGAASMQRMRVSEDTPASRPGNVSSGFAGATSRNTSAVHSAEA